MILVRFYAFDCFGCFYVTNGYFMDFVIFGDYISCPRCMGFLELWRIIDSVRGRLISGEIEVLVWF